jgi:hypothetical protein
VFCQEKKSISHMFFQCNIIKEFWEKVVQGHPLGRRLQMSSIVDYWHACLNISLLDMIFWGTLLLAAIWIIWIERNKMIFQGLGGSAATSLYMKILSLFKFWTGLLTHLEYLFKSDVLALEGAVPIHDAVVSHGESREHSSGEDIDLLDA